MRNSMREKILNPFSWKSEWVKSEVMCKTRDLSKIVANFKKQHQNNSSHLSLQLLSYKNIRWIPIDEFWQLQLGAIRANMY